MSKLKKLWDWVNKDDARTWVSHAAIAVGIALVLSPAWALGYYTFREVEQVFMRIITKQPLHPLDHFMDVAAPAVAVGIVALF